MSQKVDVQELHALEVRRYGWAVTFAGMGINLALGILYTWSVISKAIPSAWGWSEAEKSLPYAIACLVFAVVMVPGGRMQDKLGPRVVATIGGFLVGAGMIIASFFTVPIGYILGFGVLGGAGIGFGYASATPAAVKWFPAAKTGMVAGLVVSGFGLASVYAAPLAKGLIAVVGLNWMMFILGVAFLIVIVGIRPFWRLLWDGLAYVLHAPPDGYVPQEIEKAERKHAVSDKENYTPGQMLRTWQFWLLWFMYACGAGAGLMVIAKLARIAQVQAGIDLGFILVAALAVGNGVGRIVAGILSDKIGRKMTMFICFVLQAVLVFALSQTHEGSFLANAGVLAVFSALIGANYGANLTLFPASTKDFYGLKNFGVNYGLVFTSWGVGGFMLSMLAGWVYDMSKAADPLGQGNFNFAYYCSAGLLVVAALLTFALRAPHHPGEPPADAAEPAEA